MSFAWLMLFGHGVFAEPTSDVSAGPAEFGIGEKPGWVIDVEAPDAASMGEAELHDGIADLLTETQIRIGDEPLVQFNRYVSRVAEPSGISTVAKIQISFSPSFQELELHWVNLIRDGVVQERLATEDVRIIQQEDELDRDLYNQQNTALIFLDDVRVGDHVDYAFSLRGSNPIFAGRYQDWLYLNWWYPYGKIYNRIVAPATRRLQIRPHRTDLEATISRLGDQTVYVWSVENVAAAHSEGETPGDFDPLAAIQISEFESWRDVSTWASETFRVEPDADDDVVALAARISTQHPDPADQIIAALRFVQDEVRYLGIEIGVNAFRPHPPSLTLERRYGDCKDKSALLVAILGELGIDAHVALVNTEFRGRIKDWQPTAGAFDHAIVMVEYRDRIYWLDGTLSYERGPLSSEEWFAYEQALIVDSTSEGLMSVEAPRPDISPTRVTYSYRTEDYEKPSRLEVESIYSGDRADGLRGWLATTNMEEVGRQYQNYYARDYSKIDTLEPIQIEDDEVLNQIRVREIYAVPDLWLYDEDQGRYMADFRAREIRSNLSTPDTVQRSHPLAYSHPIHTKIVIRIEAPEQMNVDDEQAHIESPAFEIDYRAGTSDDGVVTLQYLYRSTSRRIEPEDVALHLEAIDDAWGSTNYSLRSSRQGAAAGGGEPATRQVIRRSVALMSLGLSFFFISAAPIFFGRGLQSFTMGATRTSLRQLRIARWSAFLRPITRARSDLVMAEIYRVTGYPEKARAIAARWARGQSRSLSRRAIQSNAHSMLAELLGEKDTEQAMVHAEHAVKLAPRRSSANADLTGSSALLCRAIIHAQRGDPTAAEEDLAQAQSNEDGSVFWAYNSMRAQALIALNSNESKLAFSMATRNVEIIAMLFTAQHPYRVETLRVLSQAAGKYGETDVQWRAYDQARSLTEQHQGKNSPLLDEILAPSSD